MVRIEIPPETPSEEEEEQQQTAGADDSSGTWTGCIDCGSRPLHYINSTEIDRANYKRYNFRFCVACARRNETQVAFIRQLRSVTPETPPIITTAPLTLQELASRAVPAVTGATIYEENRKTRRAYRMRPQDTHANLRIEPFLMPEQFYRRGVNIYKKKGKIVDVRRG